MWFHSCQTDSNIKPATDTSTTACFSFRNVLTPPPPHLKLLLMDYVIHQHFVAFALWFSRVTGAATKSRLSMQILTWIMGIPQLSPNLGMCRLGSCICASTALEEICPENSFNPTPSKISGRWTQITHYTVRSTEKYHHWSTAMSWGGYDEASQPRVRLFFFFHFLARQFNILKFYIERNISFPPGKTLKPWGSEDGDERSGVRSRG